MKKNTCDKCHKNPQAPTATAMIVNVQTGQIVRLCVACNAAVKVAK